MFDELLDNLTDRDRSRRGSAASGGIFDRVSRFLGGEEADDRHDASRPRQPEDDEHDDYRNRRHDRKRREFDIDFGD